VVASLDEAAINWGVKVLRYEIKDLVPPQDILHSMQAQLPPNGKSAPALPSPKG
jgi:regulator of protease activity HflC (stomatin/prohibitin superfamily)